VHLNGDKVVLYDLNKNECRHKEVGNYPVDVR
jgi:hypothetical protein